MKNAVGLGFAVLLAAAGGMADTRQVSSTAYSVSLAPGERITLPNGRVVLIGMRSHASLVDDKTGEISSQWCTANGYPGSDGELTAIAGFCSVVADDGDETWISFVGGAAGQPLSWTVMGGTGRYAGATGGGTSRETSNRGDGFAWTSKGSGTVTTK